MSDVKVWQDRSWMSLAEVGGRPSRPVTHRLRWVAHLRAKSATRRYNRRVLSEVRPDTSHSFGLASEVEAHPQTLRVSYAK